MDESDLGVVIEPTDLPDDVYPFELVDDLEGSGVRGSCAAFATRRDVTIEAREGLQQTFRSFYLQSVPTLAQNNFIYSNTHHNCASCSSALTSDPPRNEYTGRYISISKFLAILQSLKIC